MDYPKLRRKRVLVTGGAGFIGSNLCDSLIENENEVICLDNFSTGRRENIRELLKNPRFKLIEGDIRDLETCRRAVSGVEYVSHQAALGSVPRSIAEPIITDQVNSAGFLNMLVAARDAKVRRFVYASSSAVYGDDPNLPKFEDKIGHPLSPYAVTKLFNEHYAGVFAKLYGFKCIGFRYFNVFGMRQDPEGAYAAVIPKFIQLLMNGESPTIYGDGMQTRDFIHVQNVVQVNHLAFQAESDDALDTVYNVACSDRTVLSDLVPILTGLLSKYDSKIGKLKAVHAPERAGDIKHSLASIEKAEKLLGYHPTHDLKAGMTESIEWYWNNLK